MTQTEEGIKFRKARRRPIFAQAIKVEHTTPDIKGVLRHDPHSGRIRYLHNWLWVPVRVGDWIVKEEGGYWESWEEETFLKAFTLDGEPDTSELIQELKDLAETVLAFPNRYTVLLASGILTRIEAFDLEKAP